MSEKTAVRTREKCGLNYFSLNYEENEEELEILDVAYESVE